MPTADREHADATTPNPTAVVAVLGGAGMCASFMQTLVIPIQGVLPQLLDASPSDTPWVVTITLLTGAICTPIAGRLGDMFGKRRMALTVLALLVVGSIVCAVTSGLIGMIVGRGLQGVGMGVIPLGISILRDHLPPHRIGAAIALVSATLGIGASLGLPLSAVVTEYANWHTLFWVTAGLGTLTLAAVWRVLPRAETGTGGHFDVVGAIGLSIGLAAILIPVSRGNDWGWSAPITLGMFSLGVVTLAVWGWYELRTRDALVDLRVSARPAVLLTNLASIAMGFALFASQVVFPQLLTFPADLGGVGLGLIPASLVMVPAGLVMLLMSPVAGRLETRWGPKPLLVIGSMFIAVSYGVALLAPVTAWSILTVNCVFGVGIGLGFAAMPALIMSFVPRTETAAANGLNTLMRALGTSSASAVVAAVLAGSARVVDGTSIPSMAGFDQALWLGTGAAIACAAISLTIPMRGAEEHLLRP